MGEQGRKQKKKGGLRKQAGKVSEEGRETAQQAASPSLQQNHHSQEGAALSYLIDTANSNLEPPSSAKFTQPNQDEKKKGWEGGWPEGGRTVTDCLL